MPPIRPYHCLVPPPFHAMAFAWPNLRPAEYAALLASIRDVGLLVPLVVWRDFLIDGRHRLMACQELGIAVTYIEIDPRLTEEEALRYVLALNWDRRSMDRRGMTIACARLSLLAVVEQGRKRAKPGESLIEQLAKQHGLSMTNIKNVRSALLADDPELVEKLERREIAPYAAAAQARAAKKLPPQCAPASNDQQRMAREGRARMEQLRSDRQRHSQVLAQAIRREQAAIDSYERTGHYAPPLLSSNSRRVVIALFDPVERIIGTWRNEVMLATRHFVSATNGTNLRVARERAAELCVEMLRLMDAKIAQTEAEAPAGDVLPPANDADAPREAG